MSYPNWYAAAAAFLGGFPDDYLVFDAETQGKDPHSPATLPTQWGFALVQARQVVANESFLLNWTIGPFAIPEHEYKRQLDKTAAAMHSTGKHYHTTFEACMEYGLEPASSIGMFRDLMADAQQRGWSLVGHNGVAFDRPLYERVCRKLGHDHILDVEQMVDTGLLEKSRKMRHSPPHPGECSRAEWYHHISNARSFVKWSLDQACAQEYDLYTKTAAAAASAHDAAFDCLLTHHLLEAKRERSVALACSA